MKAKSFLFLLLILTQLMPGNIWASVTNVNDYLWLSSTPVKHVGNKHGDHGKSNGQKGHANHESEHRPKMMRTYWLSSCDISRTATAYAVQPEGEHTIVPIKREGHIVNVTTKMPFGEGPFHGANTIYLVDQSVLDKTLTVKTAKWLTIHHSCGWGHDHKFNKKRLQAQKLTQAPIEIIVDDLWDMNFHSKVMSGDTINLSVLSYGKPVAGAVVTVISDKGWQKQVITDQKGRGSFQMVTDYFPESWPQFNRGKRGKLKLTAAYEADLVGTFEDKPYNKVQMYSTFSWRYYPAVSGYSSLSIGLLVAVICLSISGLSIFIYRDRRSKSYRNITFDE